MANYEENVVGEPVEPEAIIEVAVVPEAEAVGIIEPAHVVHEVEVVEPVRVVHPVRVVEEVAEPVAIVETARPAKPHHPAQDVVEVVQANGAVTAAVVHDDVRPIPIQEVKVKHHHEVPVPNSVYALQENVDVAREELGLSIENLMGTITALNPATQVKHCVENAKTAGQDAVKHTIGDIQGFFKGEGFPEDPQRAKLLKIALAIGGSIFGTILFRAVRKDLKEHHQTKILKKAAREAAFEAVKEMQPATVIETGPVIEVDPVVIEDIDDLPVRKHKRRHHRH